MADSEVSGLSRRALLQSMALTALPIMVPFPLSSRLGLDHRVPRTDQGIRQLDEQDLAWLRDAKFGMFIHWGLYAGPGRGEWVMHQEAIPPERYAQLASPASGEEYFAADQYDPSAWASLAHDAGMRWMCLTARHHDGFCLFKSPHPASFSSWNTHHRDFVAEYVAACRKANLKVGLYFSPINWRYPGYYDVTGADCKRNVFGYKTDPAHKENARLMKEENYANVHWLMTQYGRVDHIFWDGGWLAEQGSDADAAFFHEPGRYLDPMNPWQIGDTYLDREASGRALGIMGVTRKHQPKAIVNPRYGWLGDYMDDEGGQAVTGPIRDRELYQKCMTTAGSWGFDRGAIDGGHVLSADQIVAYLVDCVVRDMVLLLNVGPDRHGVIPGPVAENLRAAGQWIHKAAAGIYGTRGGPWQPTDGQYGYCYREDRLYVHLMAGWQGDSFDLPNSRVKPLAARELLSGKQLGVSAQDGQGHYRLTGLEPLRTPNRVVEVRMNGPIVAG